MRLTRLEIKGFGAFRAQTVLTFDDADFFALVGPTGSGKSTILDAVCFALYGSVPRYESENLIRYVVSLGAVEAKVRLDFELGGDAYIATRVLRRTAKGSVQTKEARLERVLGGDKTEVIAGEERTMSKATVELLGLRFEDFTRCVALPQGDFARFLRAKGDERRDLMVRLLNFGVYSEVGRTARQLADVARSEIRLLESQLDKLAFATPETQAAAEARQADVVRLQEAVEAAQPVLAELATGTAAANAAAQAAEAWVKRLAAVAVPAAVREFAGRHRQAADASEAAEEALAGLRAAREAAEQHWACQPETALLLKALDAHDKLVDCKAAIAEAESQLEAQAEAHTAAAGALEAAEAAARQAATDREARHRQHLAQSLVEGLKVGEPCPVCDHVVDRLPQHAPAGALQEADAAATAADQALAKARRAASDTDNAQAGSTSRIETLGRQRDILAGEVAAHPDRGALEAMIDTVAQADQALKAARAVEQDGAAHAAQAKAALKQLDAAALDARNQFSAQRDTVVGLDPPAAGQRDVLADWEALAAWAATAAPEQTATAEAAAAEAGRLTTARQEQLALLLELFEQLEVPAPPGGDTVVLVGAVAKATAEAASVLERIKDAIAQATELQATTARLDEEADVAELLGKLLKADRFPEWLVAEALGRLAADASEILRQLTGGQYSLAVGEKEFVVIDHANADEQRPARTLSGGETFQASLALALALSQQIRNLAADGAPRLDAIFLDEGFGTLDPDTLDTVAATIENLGQSGRMVGVVTHVAELAARVPVRFEVRKAIGGATVEKVLA